MHAPALAVASWLMLRTVAAVKLHTDCWQGEDAASSGFPWHASVFWRSDEQPRIYQYLSAGVLVDERHILTDMSGFDGHQPDWVLTNFSEVFVMLGNPSIRWNPDANAGTQISKVARVFFHDEYTQGQYWYYRKPIAVVELEVPVDFTDKVKPACIDSSAPVKDGDTGLVAAPDLSGGSTPRAVMVDYVTREDCIDKHETVTKDKFCANSHDEALCPEGVGGGLLVRSADGRWLLKGVITVNSARQPFAVDTCAANLSVISSVDQLIEFILTNIHQACYNGPSKALPWHAMIYKELSGDNQYQYICGGTLVSRRFIVSDGSCFWNSSSGEMIDARQLVVALGKKWKSPDVTEHKAQIFGVSSLTVRHPGGREGMGLLELESPAEFDGSVAAVCLDTARETSAEDITFGTVATVEGDESSAVKLHGLRYVNYSECSDENATQPVGTFCARDRKATLCPETAGSGLLTRDADGRWLLKGVARHLPDGSPCLQHSALFTATDHALRWILDTMLNSTVSPHLLKPSGNEGCWSGTLETIPWNVLIYRSLQRPDWYTLSCMGSLITRRHVISNLDCFLDKDSGEMNIRELRITVGKETREWKATNRQVQIRKVSHVSAMDGHKDNNKSLAVATLETPVKFNNAVHSICMDFSNALPEEGVQFGLVPVFDSPQESTIKLLNMTISYTSSCAETNGSNTGGNLNSTNKLCAADHEGMLGLCQANSGAGLVVRGPSGEWLLGGVVSAQETRPHQLSCEDSSVSLTAVSGYLPWLREMLRRRRRARRG